MAETNEEQRKRNWLEIQDGLNPGEDPIDRMLSDMAWAETGWHRVRNESGWALILPDVPNHPSGSAEARAAEDAWEARAMAMHAQQEALTLAPKPSENAMTRIERGD